MGESRRMNQGFSLVEAMIAAAIFAAVILSMGQLVISLLDAMREADRLSLVLSRAEDYFSRSFVIPFGADTDDPATNTQAEYIFDNDLDGLYAEASLHSLLNRAGGEFSFNTVQDPTNTHPFAYLVGGSWQIRVNHDIDGDGTQGAHALENSNKIVRVEVYFTDFDDSNPIVSGVRYGG